MKLAVACDHAALEGKTMVVAHLRARGHDVTDCGTHTSESVDYPDYARAVVTLVQQGKADAGVLLCGTGIGMCMAANKARGIRAALLSDTFSAHMCREHNDANVICFGVRVLGPELIKACIDAYLSATYHGDRHAKRVAKIMDMGNEGA